MSYKKEKYIDSDGRELSKLIHEDKVIYRNKLDEFQRIDGPSVIRSNGTEEYWYKNGQLHRLDGPAITVKNVYKAWYINGKLHKSDGPALIYSDGREEYWVNGDIASEKEIAIIWLREQVEK